MDPIVDLAMPTVIFLMMTVVGHSLTPTDLRKSATDLRAVAAATIGQIVLLPLIATFIVLTLEPGPTITAGLILVAACPGGSVSNFYACLARSNVALSVTLTFASCLLSFLTLPVLVAAGFKFWLDDLPRIEIPIAVFTLQLLILVAVPILAGMILRRWRPDSTHRRDLLLRRMSLVALLALVSYVVFDQRSALVASAPRLILSAFLFTALTMAAGYLLGWITGRPIDDRLTYLIEFPCRNLALAVVVSISILGRSDFVAFAVVLLLVQALTMITLTVILRRGPAHDRA
jgi:BASS family bile acid:Na+ symporter